MSNRFKHGETRRLANTKEYIAWNGMMQRCYNENYISYPYYGGRGIKVCDRWRNSYENFLADMGRAPSKNHSLDRFPDNNADYGPGNCRWATLAEQAKNRRIPKDALWVNIFGTKILFQKLIILTGIKETTLYERIFRKGKDPEASIADRKFISHCFGHIG